MKLWQQIFLISLAFIMAAIGTVTLLVLTDYFSSSVQREEENAVALHGYLSSGVAGSVVWQRLSEGLPRLSAEQTEEVLRQQIEQQSVFAYACVQDAQGARVCGSLPDGIPAELAGKAQETDGCLTLILELGGQTFLTVGSAVTLEGEPYVLLSVTDVTELYRIYREQIFRGMVLSVAFAAGIALVLLVLCQLLLRPLSRVNRALKRLANGERGYRLPETGGQELRELSSNINAMASAIEEQTRLLQETADSRKRFVDSMAHEMKTPLTSILCMADLLRIKRSVTESERAEYAGVIVEEAKRMKALSSKLLTLASADSSKPDFRESSLSELLDEVRSAMLPILERRGIRLTVAGSDLTVWVDRQLFQTLLINLIDNAAKASSEGQQVLVCHTVQEGRLLLAVIDEGIGMTAEELRHATEAFWMADKSRSRKAGGAGLGLSLCEEIVRLHDAVMTMTSEPGKGTTVLLNLPLARKEKS